MFKPVARLAGCVGLFILACLMGPTGPVAAQEQAIVSVPETTRAEPVEEVREASEVFGAYLFNGAFAEQSFAGFSPDYQVAIGDTVALSIWGGFEFQGELVVDAQGNIFVPRVGPVAVRGVRNADLNTTVMQAVSAVFKSNVGVYAALDGAKPVQVLVTGFVDRAGVYAGQSSDSVLYFLDKAGGIDEERGSFRSVRLLRGGETVATIDLYDFILDGRLPLMQMRNGDTLVVDPMKIQVSVTGEARNAYRFEFEKSVALDRLIMLAAPEASATHVRIDRNSRAQDEVEYLPISQAAGVELANGDRVSVATDKLPGTISVRVEGEHNSQQEFVLPYGSTLDDLLARVDVGQDAEVASIQLLRESVKARQKEMLETQLRALESSVLTARSRTSNEASLRRIEAELVLRWLDRAREVEPRGQVTLAKVKSYTDIRLEQGDIVRIPRKSNLLMIHGDVLFPNAVAFQSDATVEDYIEQAGGFTQSKRATRVLVLHRDGTFIRLKHRELDDDDLDLRPGDEIFVLPKVEQKNFQFASDIIEVLYQLALSAGVVLAI